MNIGAAAQPTATKSKWPALPELALAACLVALALFTAVVARGDKIAGESAPDAWWEWALVVAPALPAAFRRVAPLIATPITVVAQIVVWGLGLASAFFVPLVMIYTVTSEAGEKGRRVGIASCVALVLMTTLGVFVAPDVSIDLLVFTSLASSLAYLLGTQSAKARRAEVALAGQLAVAQVERDRAQERAAVDERQRIARELHDIVGHSLSVIAVRAEAADRVAPKNPGAAVDAVAAIASTARASLADVRRVLAGLREDESQPELAPLPSITSVPALVASFADAGMAVELVNEITAATEVEIGAAIGSGAYRIVQEALTNVLKHAGPGAAATVQLRAATNQLMVEIEDSGRGATPDRGHDGVGLAGMAERAEVLGGSLMFGPRTGGGYRVAAILPFGVANQSASAHASKVTQHD